MREIALAAGLFAANAAQGDPSFRLPLDCSFGEGRPCYIQSLMDHDPRPGASRDHRCGAQSRDAHNGTDFALTSLQDMKRGVDVIAAAPGIVVATRDGMIDHPITPETRDQIAGRECGNAVVLSHGDGWQTQYCHLKRGSVAVKRGQQIAEGEKLGQVGLSGMTSFPHLHLTVRHHDRIVDPFAADAAGSCATDTARSLWQDTPIYRPTGLITAGFAPDLPRYEDIKSGAQQKITVSTESKALVLWAYAFGGLPGDILRFAITGPDGVLWHEKEITLNGARPLYYRGTGKRIAGQQHWISGTYQGKIQLKRDDRIVSDKTVTLTIGN